MSEAWHVGFLVSDWDGIQKKTPGVARKIQGQVKALGCAGLRVDLVPVGGHSLRSEKVLDRVPFYSDYEAWREALDANYDGLYIRRPSYVSSGMLKALREYRTKRPDSLVVYEVPTWPYDAEDRTLPRLPIHIKDLMHRGGLRDVVDRVADLSGTDSIFGIQTLPIINGIDLDSVRRRNVINDNDGVVNIVCVAAFARWHGADRLLQGLAEYRRKGEPCGSVHLNLVGDGPELDALKRIAETGNLSDIVTFHGMLDASGMVSVYDRCQVGVASLGLHRIGLDRASTLKTREYLAKGLPFAYSGEIDVFEGRDIDFCLQVPADESPLDIEGVVRFYRSLVDDCEEDALAARIRSFAESHVSVVAAMASVASFFKNEEIGCA